MLELQLFFVSHIGATGLTRTINTITQNVYLFYLFFYYFHIFKQLVLKWSIKWTADLQNIKYYIISLMLFYCLYIIPEQLFKALIKILTLMFISVLIVIPSELIPLVRGN